MAVDSSFKGAMLEENSETRPELEDWLLSNSSNHNRGTCAICYWRSFEMANLSRHKKTKMHRQFEKILQEKRGTNPKVCIVSLFVLIKVLQLLKMSRGVASSIDILRPELACCFRKELEKKKVQGAICFRCKYCGMYSCNEKYCLYKNKHIKLMVKHASNHIYENEPELHDVTPSENANAVVAANAHQEVKH